MVAIWYSMRDVLYGGDDYIWFDLIDYIIRTGNQASTPVQVQGSNMIYKYHRLLTLQNEGRDSNCNRALESNRGQAIYPHDQSART